MISGLADGVIGIGIAATAVGLVAGGIAAALSRKKWFELIVHTYEEEITRWGAFIFLLFFCFFFFLSAEVK